MKRYIRKKHRPQYVMIESHRYCVSHELVVTEGDAQCMDHARGYGSCVIVDLFYDANPLTRGGHTKYNIYGLFWCTTHDQTCRMDDHCRMNSRYQRFKAENYVECDMVPLYRKDIGGLPYG